MPGAPADCAARYRVERLLGEGAYGRVYLAEQEELGRPVALKILRSEIPDDDDQRRRLVDGGRIVARMSHPNIVRVIDAGAACGTLWLVFELVDGPSLRETMAQGENVLRAADGSYKLADFGIARWTADSRVKTAAGVFLGTPTHVAPELIRGGEPSAARLALRGPGGPAVANLCAFIILLSATLAEPEYRHGAIPRHARARYLGDLLAILASATRDSSGGRAAPLIHDVAKLGIDASPVEQHWTGVPPER